MVTDLSSTHIKEPEGNATAPESKEKKVNLLIDIPPVIRVSIIIYFLVYKVFFPVKGMFGHDFLLEEMLIRILNLVTDFALLAPLMFKWKDVGLLHPLAWPTLFALAKSLKAPGYYLKPFLADDSIISPIANQVSSVALSANLKVTFLTLVALLLTYLGYYITNKRVQLTFKARNPPPNSRKRLITWAIICFIVAMAFFLSQGGVMAWVDSWGIKGGRSEAMEGLGPILSFIGGLYYIPALWILIRKKQAIKDPIFIFFAVIFALGAFAASGSRYGVLQAITIYLMCWVSVNRSFPIVKVIVGGFIFLILFGMLGMLRTSGTYQGTQANWNVLDQDASTYLTYTFAEGTKRSQERPDQAVMEKVPEEVDYLYGKTYLYLLATYIPRAIWADKPHSGAYYTGLYIFKVNWGIPIGEVGEVFWNFGVFGFLLFFIFKGFVYKVFVNTFNARNQYAAIAVFYFLFLFGGGSFASLTLGDFVRESIFLFMGLKFLKLI